jgi:hypothetical protein
MAFPVAQVFQVISFLVQHKDQIRQAVKDLETIMPNVGGNAKLQVIKNIVGIGMGIEAQIEALWPLVAPMFSALVSNIKGVTPAVTPTVTPATPVTPVVTPAKPA